VQALAAEHLVVYASPNGGVRLGPGLANLAAGARRELRHELRPYLIQLSRQLDETVDLAVLEGDRVLFVDQAAVPRRLAAVSFVGATFPAHCTANGKVLLATLPDHRIEQLLPRRLERLTPNTVTDRRLLLGELATVRQQGVAFDREEHTVGICAVGAVVHDPAGPLAAVTIPMPSTRFYGAEQHLAGVIRSACAEMSAVLGSV
jgi:DNA-binding IclR family transcriptional regulator